MGTKRKGKPGICEARLPGCFKVFTVTPGYTESSTVCYSCQMQRKENENGNDDPAE